MTPDDEDTEDAVVDKLRNRLERGEIEAAKGRRRLDDLRRELAEILEHGDDMT